MALSLVTFELLNARTRRKALLPCVLGYPQPTTPNGCAHALIRSRRGLGRDVSSGLEIKIQYNSHEKLPAFSVLGPTAKKSATGCGVGAGS